MRRTDGRDQEGKHHHGCPLFVLDLKHDPFALVAIARYANACAEDEPKLAVDLIQKYMPRPLDQRIMMRLSPGRWLVERDVRTLLTEHDATKLRSTLETLGDRGWVAMKGLAMSERCEWKLTKVGLWARRAGIVLEIGAGGA